jgi:hypothetical protein
MGHSMRKSLIRRYIDYLKDNPKKYWFKRRWYGWGWVPAKPEGWFVILSFIGILLLNGVYFASKISPNGNASNTDLILFFGIMIISIILLFTVCYKKGEKPRWSWGE